MSDFRQQAELTKLAGLLRCTPSSLDFLKTQDIATLQKLRESTSRLILDEHRKLFGRIASASKLLPNALIALIAERSMGPLLCARVAGEMPVDRAIDIAKHLKPPFMAKAALHLETQRACELTAALPLSSVIAITQELISQHEFILLGDMVDHLPVDLVSKIIPSIQNGEALLRSAFFVQNTARLTTMLETLPEATLRTLIRAAADEHLDLWPHALALMSVVPVPWQEKLVGIALSEEESTLASMVKGVVKHNLWSIALPLLDLMPTDGKQRLVNLPTLSEPDVQRQVLAAAYREGFWHYLLPLIPLMNPALRQQVGQLTDELNEDAIRTLADLAHQNNQWFHALLLVDYMSVERRATIAEIMADSSDDALNGLLATVHENHQWHIALPLVAYMSPAAKQRFASLPFVRDVDMLSAMVKATDAHDLWATSLPIIDLMPVSTRETLVALPRFF